MCLLEEYSYRLRPPYSKYLKSDLYELRVSGKHAIRLLYSFKDDQIYIVHAFIKKTQKTPKKEIELALARLKELL